MCTMRTGFGRIGVNIKGCRGLHLQRWAGFGKDFRWVYATARFFGVESRALASWSFADWVYMVSLVWGNGVLGVKIPEWLGRCRVAGFC